MGDLSPDLQAASAFVAAGRRRSGAGATVRARASWRAAAALLRAGAWVLLVAGVQGCATAYPTFSTPVRDVPPTSGELDPAPPEDLFYLQMRSAKIPKRTRDGRAWDEVGGKAPDPFAIVFLDGREIFRTRPQADTLAPTWPGSPGGNFRVGPRAELRIELYVSNRSSTPHLHGRDHGYRRGRLHRWSRGPVRQRGDGRARRRTAHAVWGVGAAFEVHFGEVVVTRVDRSRGVRAGLVRELGSSPFRASWSETWWRERRARSSTRTSGRGSA
jgi:hypothetical protein